MRIAKQMVMSHNTALNEIIVQLREEIAEKDRRVLCLENIIVEKDVRIAELKDDIMMCRCNQVKDAYEQGKLDAHKLTRGKL